MWCTEKFHPRSPVENKTFENSIMKYLSRYAKVGSPHFKLISYFKKFTIITCKIAVATSLLRLSLRSEMTMPTAMPVGEAKEKMRDAVMKYLTVIPCAWARFKPSEKAMIPLCNITTMKICGAWVNIMGVFQGWRTPSWIENHSSIHSPGWVDHFPVVGRFPNLQRRNGTSGLKGASLTWKLWWMK